MALLAGLSLTICGFVAGQYHVSEELVKDSVKVPFSSFKSKSVRQFAPAVTAVSWPDKRAYTQIYSDVVLVE